LRKRTEKAFAERNSNLYPAKKSADGWKKVGGGLSAAGDGKW